MSPKKLVKPEPKATPNERPAKLVDSATLRRIEAEIGPLAPARSIAEMKLDPETTKLWTDAKEFAPHADSPTVRHFDADGRELDANGRRLDLPVTE